MKSKVETYIGFAIKKGSAVLGCDSIKSCKKHMQLLLYTANLSDNSLSVLREVSARTGCQLAQIDEYEILKMRNCKALAICDKSLANAICENLM
ncbi:MAG: hypothetical protein J1F65_00700 [Clostridiales bacterium]|nr:hypothetical protein [Clostridiales bacterium]